MATNEPKRFYLDTQHKMIWGVCSGFAKYFNFDVTIVRIVWLIVTIASFGTGVLLYILIALIAPKA
jgi:phage shock protein C